LSFRLINPRDGQLRLVHQRGFQITRLKALVGRDRFIVLGLSFKRRSDAIRGDRRQRTVAVFANKPFKYCLCFGKLPIRELRACGEQQGPFCGGCFRVLIDDFQKICRCGRELRRRGRGSYGAQT
jgi:hypothetical protein